MNSPAAVDAHFWKSRRVFITGHTGFKGSWLSIWLAFMGARVTGYSLEPPTSPSLFLDAGVADLLEGHVHGDIRDPDALGRAMAEAEPEVAVHMAAQPLVRESYHNPVATYETNVMGTVNFLRAVGQTPGVAAAINVTSDKCYENREWLWGYRENEPMGGHDPYSSSKGCSELVTTAWRESFFHESGPALASARAGNVIGGGDWAADRLIPDFVRALMQDKKLAIRNPLAVRPWQHVLEPLSGYLVLAQNLVAGGREFASGWNFGPEETDACTVGELVDMLCRAWGRGACHETDPGPHVKEASNLKLDCSKARALLGWRPVWSLERALKAVASWTRGWMEGADPAGLCREQIGEYLEETGPRPAGSAT
jgi:CDP-glucose 4,6-dehydratase